jgi:hypothetical protein
MANQNGDGAIVDKPKAHPEPAATLHHELHHTNHQHFLKQARSAYQADSTYLPDLCINPTQTNKDVIAPRPRANDSAFSAFEALDMDIKPINPPQQGQSAFSAFEALDLGSSLMADENQNQKKMIARMHMSSCAPPAAER